MYKTESECDVRDGGIAHSISNEQKHTLIYKGTGLKV